MLVELAVRDLALLERASLSFGPGLNVITGETGAGKSLLLSALDLLLGRRARADLVRRGATRARVEGRFVLPFQGYGETVVRWLSDHLPEALEEGEEEGDGRELELILARTVSRDGRSRAHVNHRPVTSRALRELAERLVEVHGQNDQQTLFEPAEQVRLLDSFARLEDAHAGYRERRAKWLERLEALEHRDEHQAERLQRLDLLRFQAGELASVAQSLAARADLVDEREVLRHADQIARDLGGTLDALSEREDSALDVLRRGERTLEEWAARVETLSGAAGALREATAQAEEAASALARFLGGVEADPARLEEVERVLDELERLARKYRTDAAGLAERHEAVLAELAQLSAQEEGAQDLEAEVARALASVAESARRLTTERKKARKALEQAVHSALAELGLGNASFEVALDVQKTFDATDVAAARRRFGPHGEGELEFRLAANPGEERGALRSVASGGEAARILLALRGALAVRQSTPTLVFDEVDAGVGGRLGPKVGAHLAALSGHHQVLVVTHLPAIAALADRHLRVVKEVAEGRTRTAVTHLTGEARVEEIADMIAGGSAHETARAEARRLLGTRE